MKGRPALPRKLITTEEAAEMLGVKKNTLEVWRCTKRYDLPWVKVGRSVKYDQADIETFIEAQKQRA